MKNTSHAKNGLTYRLPREQFSKPFQHMKMCKIKINKDAIIKWVECTKKTSDVKNKQHFEWKYRELKIVVEIQIFQRKKKHQFNVKNSIQFNTQYMYIVQ